MKNAILLITGNGKKLLGINGRIILKWISEIWHKDVQWINLVLDINSFELF
jgi:hypothetical protein